MRDQGWRHDRAVLVPPSPAHDYRHLRPQLVYNTRPPPPGGFKARRFPQRERETERDRRACTGHIKLVAAIIHPATSSIACVGRLQGDGLYVRIENIARLSATSGRNTSSFARWLLAGPLGSFSSSTALLPSMVLIQDGCTTLLAPNGLGSWVCPCSHPFVLPRSACDREP